MKQAISVIEDYSYRNLMGHHHVWLTRMRREPLHKVPTPIYNSGNRIIKIISRWITYFTSTFIGIWLVISQNTKGELNKAIDKKHLISVRNVDECK